jgi:hypothetical protein
MEIDADGTARSSSTSTSGRYSGVGLRVWRRRGAITFAMYNRTQRRSFISKSPSSSTSM